MGIDYGHGMVNINHETGIRYGVISQNTVCQAWSESSEPDYDEATCPKCGNEAVNLDSIGPDDTDIPSEGESEFENWTSKKWESHDYACRSCKHFFGSESAFGDTPQGYSLDDGRYKATDCLDSDIMVLESPFYTFAPFCSPCVPGAGNLDGAGDLSQAAYPFCEIEESDFGPRTYCFGHDWFYDTETGIAPYPVYGVVSQRECFPDSWYGR